MNAELPLLLTTAELAEHLKISTRHVRRLSAAHKIPQPVRVGVLHRWRADDVRQFIQSHGVKAEVM